MRPIGELIDWLISYARREVWVSIVLVVLAVGLALRLLDVISGLLDRRTPLDPRERARLALAAPYFIVHSFRDGDVVGKRPLGRLWMRILLRKDWGIRDHASALGRLEDLVRYGHRSDPEYQDATQPREDQELVDRAMLAWDAIRVPFLARCALAAGFIDEAALWHYADVAAVLARGTFSDWQQWGNAFLDGRVIWSGERSYYETVVEKLLADHKSPWNRVSWQEATAP